MKTQGIYMIRNTTNDRHYVGSSKNVERRLYCHRHMLQKGTHHSRILQRAWDKHGADSFVFQIIETVVDNADLLTREQHHIDRLNAADSRKGYNVCAVAGTREGVPQPASVAEKMRVVHLGKEKSHETRAKMSVAAKARPPKTEEHKQKLREAAQAQFADPAARLHQSKMQTGKRHSIETKAKISIASKGHAVSDECRAATAERNKNRAWTDEMRAKISASKIGCTASAETREKMSVARKGKKRTPNENFKHSDEWRANHAAKLKQVWADRKAQGVKYR
jgi:group I intron endonuclease